jgi:hypothetical protein
VVAPRDAIHRSGSTWPFDQQMKDYNPHSSFASINLNYCKRTDTFLLKSKLYSIIHIRLYL